MFDSESEIQQLIQAEAVKYGCILMRNNSGAMTDSTGRHVRFGLDNTSAKRNEQIKSSDLIGFTVIGFGPGTAVFTAIEVKTPGWKYKGDKREIAQLAFINWVKSKGGIAAFCQSVDDFKQLMKNHGVVR